MAHKTIWITGASSGIGRALAELYAARGNTVAVSARSADALQALAQAHETVHAYPLDITDAEAVQETARQIEAEHGSIDLVIQSAAMWSQMGVDEFDAVKIRQSMDVNYGGTVNVVSAMIGPMMKRRAGHIAIIASVAGYVGLPLAIAYGPTKAALISFAESLKPDLDRYNVTVSVVNPGFVETPLTASNDFPMPFSLQPDDAAQRIARGLDRRKFEIAFPWQFISIMKTLRELPYGALFRVTRQMIEKRAEKKRAEQAQAN